MYIRGILVHTSLICSGENGPSSALRLVPNDLTKPTVIHLEPDSRWTTLHLCLLVYVLYAELRTLSLAIKSII